MNNDHPHDIIRVRPGKDEIPPNYRPLTPKQNTQLQPMTPEERAAWLAMHPMEPWARTLMQRAQEKRDRKANKKQ